MLVPRPQVTLLTARGVQTKVIEALAARLPPVVTSQVRDGLPREVIAACRVADTPETFGEHVLALLGHSGQERRAIAAKADLASLSWERQLAPLHEVLSAAASQGHCSVS